MLKYAIIFALISLIADALGFGGIAAGSAGIGHPMQMKPSSSPRMKTPVRSHGLLIISGRCLLRRY